MQSKTKRTKQGYFQYLLNKYSNKKLFIDETGVGYRVDTGGCYAESKKVITIHKTYA